MGDQLKFYRLSDATFYDCINTMYHFIKPFLDNKMSIFEEYGAFNIFSLLFTFKIYKAFAGLVELNMF